MASAKQAMGRRSVHSTPWLFAFVDLAFLLLIVMTQVAEGVDLASVELGDITLPKVQWQAANDLPGHARQLWQLRVHQPRGGAGGPFELVAAGGEPDATTGERISLAALSAGLLSLREAGESKPLLAPHRKSESQHLLEAVAALEEVWPSGRRSTIARLASN